ncbi:hypothetical protein [Rhodoblastus sp.]|uniref:hypothetical protein n=1 Tax=Rhodoblastus sp. TaxID=1962975 RepID=UPI003F9A7BF0
MSLTAPRATIEVQGRELSLPVAANVEIFQGALVMQSGGNATPGAVAAGAIGVGMAVATADNLGGAAGAINVIVRKGVFYFANYASDLVPASQIGQNCYIFDDQTVAATSATNTRSVAGLVFNVDAGGVWVKFV